MPFGMSKRQSRLREPCVHVLLPLLFGGSAYLLWRPSSLLMFAWLDQLALTGCIRPAREWGAAIAASVPAWLVMSVPAALWSYAVVSWIGWVWGDEPSAEGKCWMLAASMLGPLSELGQRLQWVPGTFDPVDLVFYFVGVLLAVLRISCPEGHHVEKSSANVVRAHHSRAASYGYR